MGGAGAFARLRGLDQLPWTQKIMEHAAYDAFWQGQALDKLVAERPSAVPTMWIQGLWDRGDMWGTFPSSLGRKKKGQTNPNTLVMGPGTPSRAILDATALGPLSWDAATPCHFRLAGFRPSFV